MIVRSKLVRTSFTVPLDAITSRYRGLAVVSLKPSTESPSLRTMTSPAPSLRGTVLRVALAVRVVEAESDAVEVAVDEAVDDAVAMGEVVDDAVGEVNTIVRLATRK